MSSISPTVFEILQLYDALFTVHFNFVYSAKYKLLCLYIIVLCVIISVNRNIVTLVTIIEYFEQEICIYI